MITHMYTNGRTVTPTVRRINRRGDDHAFFLLTLVCGDDEIKIFLPDDPEQVADLRQRIFTTPVGVVTV